MFARTTALVFCALLGSCSGGEAPPAASTPGGAATAGAGTEIRRVLLVSCDTLRADRLGLYGCGQETSPNLDAFARGARVYDQAFSTTSLTHPAMSAVLTGRMPDEIGMSGGNRQQMPAEVVTLAEVLGANGIATAAIVSNWVLRGLEGRPGEGIAQGFEHFDDRMDVRELNRESFERAGPATTDAALAWLTAREADAGEQPYFLWVHYQDPHGPYTAPEEFLRPEQTVPGDRRLKQGKTHSGARQLPSYQWIEGQRQSAFYRAQYDAEVRYFDHEVGRLFDWLAGEGLLDSSLIVFTADHGESLGEHDYWFCHGETLARELVRVPFLVRSPRTTPGRSSALTGHLDVFATVLDAFDLAPQASRGSSVLALDPDPERVLVQTLFRRQATVRLEAVTDGRWRLIQNLQKTRLYDLQADPGEEHDLARSEQRVVKGLQQQLEQYWKAAPGAIVAEGAEAALDAEALRAFDALGYTGGKEEE